MYKQHPLFVSPPDKTLLWRYIDFTKYVSILETKSLFFSTPNNFDDPFEGVLHLTEIFKHPELKPRTIAYQSLQSIIDHNKSLNEHIFINCWCKSPHESDAMWRLYSDNYGIAVKTDFESLKSSFMCQEDVYIGNVNYSDDINNEFDYRANSKDELVYRYMFKKRSFEHENEVRAISTMSDSIISKDDIDITGRYYRVDLSVLIKEVIVNPFAPEWFFELVESVTSNYKDNIKFKISKSDLYKYPIN